MGVNLVDAVLKSEFSKKNTPPRKAGGSAASFITRDLSYKLGKVDGYTKYLIFSIVGKTKRRTKISRISKFGEYL